MLISMDTVAAACRIQAQLLGSSSAGFILNLPPVIFP